MGGALGRMSWAGTAVSVEKQAHRADRVMVAIAVRAAGIDKNG